MDNKNKIARKLRKISTEQERKLWAILRNRQFCGLKFKRQFPIGDYIVDFICIEKMLIIEIDGGQHNEPENIKKDRIRTAYLESRGYKVIRFWNSDINDNIDGVYTTLLQYVSF